jgi:hypothetical protein
VLLLVELFRIHQRHWDELRRREIPSFEQFRATSRSSRKRQSTFQGTVCRLAGTTEQPIPPRTAQRHVTRTAAWFAALARMLAGYLLGRAWP